MKRRNKEREKCDPFLFASQRNAFIIYEPFVFVEWEKEIDSKKKEKEMEVAWCFLVILYQDRRKQIRASHQQENS